VSTTASRLPSGAHAGAEEIRHHAPLPGGDRVHVDHRLAAFERNIGEPVAVGRPRRRHDRFARTQRRLRAGAVGIGDLQFEAVLCELHDVGDAGGEHAAFAGQFLEDAVGDPVRVQPQLCRAGNIGQRVELRLLDGVVQAEAQVVAAVGQPRGGSHYERVGALALELREADGRGFGQRRGAGVDHAEPPRPLQIGADDLVDGLRDLAVAPEVGDRNRKLVGADAGDLDAQLRGRRGQDEQRCQQGERVSEKSVHWRRIIGRGCT
jgi:hypothetical protein